MRRKAFIPTPAQGDEIFAYWEKYGDILSIREVALNFDVTKSSIQKLVDRKLAEKYPKLSNAFDR